MWKKYKPYSGRKELFIFLISLCLFHDLIVPILKSLVTPTIWLKPNDILPALIFVIAIFWSANYSPEEAKTANQIPGKYSEQLNSIYFQISFETGDIV